MNGGDSHNLVYASTCPCFCLSRRRSRVRVSSAPPFLLSDFQLHAYPSDFFQQHSGNFTGELAGAGVPQVFDGTRIWFCNYAIAQIEGAA